jgi:phage tail sheath protein FI
MPAALTYPGVYIEEIPSGVRTITGVATSITAFVGRARRGPVDAPVRIQSQAEFARVFGGLWQPSTLGYAVGHFFQHGGGDALIVRAFNGSQADNTATLTLATSDGGGGTGTLLLEAANPGTWGDRLRVTADHDTSDPGNALLFNLLIEELDQPGGSNVVASELHRNLVTDPTSPRFIDNLLAEQSDLLRVRTSAPTDQGATDGSVSVANPDGTATAAGTLGGDGSDLGDSDVIPTDTMAIANREGMYALEAADLFNLLCIPPLTRANDSSADIPGSAWANAARYCQERRALLLIDPPTGWRDVADATDSSSGINNLRSDVGNAYARNAAVYFPRLRSADPLAENRLAEFAPCGAVAGIIARTDAQRGVWKAPAGLDAAFSGIQGFTYTMTDAQNGSINPLGLNALRSFPVAGRLVWGARTLAGADQLASEWKYLPVRRLALFLEESLFRGTQWVVFEPNDEPLWSQIRLNIGAFMQNLFRQGAFQGSSPREAYFVKCDRETTTQNDIDRGIVNIVVGFAPLKPAEFVVIQIQQIAGDIET